MAITRVITTVAPMTPPSRGEVVKLSAEALKLAVLATGQAMLPTLK